MAELIVLQALGHMQGERILDEFERRTGHLQPDVRGRDRYYEVSDDQQRTRIVRTLTDIDANWTDHVAFKLKA